MQSTAIQGSHCTTRMLPCSRAELKPVSRRTNRHAQHSTQRVMNLFSTYGSKCHIGEASSICEHSLKAALAARRANEPIDVQLACLLRDIGYIVAIEAKGNMHMEGCGAKTHERIGAEFLEKLEFSDTIVYLTRQRINALRYNCGKDPVHIDTLSEATKMALYDQGGPMNATECIQAENDPLWDAVLRMRQYDDDAKDIELYQPSIPNFYADALYSSLDHSKSYEDSPQLSYAFMLSDLQLSTWKNNGMLLVKDVIPRNLAQLFGDMTDDLLLKREKHTIIKELPWVMHFEQNEINGDIQICRVENFVKHHEMWEHVCNELISPIVSQVLEERNVVLFKDELHFKRPGGGDFAYHQDATPLQRHVNVMLAIEELTTNDESPVDSGMCDHGTHFNGTFERSKVLTPGDLLLFDSHLPHRLLINTTKSWRRVAHFAFNPPC